jgi:hypothetical protein
LTFYGYAGGPLTFVDLELPATRSLVHDDPLQLPISQFQHHYDVLITKPRNITLWTDDLSRYLVEDYDNDKEFPQILRWIHASSMNWENATQASYALLYGVLYRQHQA